MVLREFVELEFGVHDKGKGLHLVHLNQPMNSCHDHLHIRDQVPMQGAASMKSSLAQVAKATVPKQAGGKGDCVGDEDSAGSCAVVNDDDCADSSAVRA